MGTTASLAAVVGPEPALGRPVLMRRCRMPNSCGTPALAGTVVDVTLTDMGGMGPGMMGPTIGTGP